MDALAGLTFGKILSVIVLFFVCVIVVKWLMKLVDKYLARTHLDKNLHGIFRSGVKALLYFIVVLILADSIGISITSLVAAFSIVGVAVSLAVQGSLSNVAGGMVVLYTKPFVVGDFVETAGNVGTVREVNLFTTKLVTLDNKVIVIPNSDISGSRIINYSTEDMRRVDMTFTASYDSGVETTKAAIMEVIQNIPQIKNTPAEPFVKVSNYLDSSIEYVVRVWTENANYWTVYFALMEGVKASFDKNNIEMTYPHMNVHVVEK